MSTTAAASADTAQPVATAPAVDAADRGRLDVDLSVVRKVAEHTADQVTATMPVRRTVAGVALGSSGCTAKVSSQGEEVALRLNVALRYPTPVRAAVADIRQRVIDEVHRITGYRVRSVAVVVSALLTESNASRVE